ncbi:hypothetical protein [Mucilaginibacter sp. OK098]|uniref:hypothetical protein n=1 Tax=Mucilaginibacter sp. OK098 TaxID=1855297 RepID=UPI0009232D18|nr:hypothetical protein [Mucilaginibacter sp. OK098]SHM80493.1 hypothetical protein SAMN05216524_103470 [Mucilaginibacter sp. OK098]
MLIISHRLTLTFILVSFTCFCSAQSVIIQSGILLPKDTTTNNQVITSLNGFLKQKEKPNNANNFVLKERLLETEILLDAMKGSGLSRKLKDSNYYKCYLTNLTRLDNDNFVAQISYMSIDEHTPVLHASYRLLAKREGTQFCFYSPLKQNTIGWKTRKFNNITYYFRDTIDIVNAKAYQKKVNFYDDKLKAPQQVVEVYLCDNFLEVQQLTGIEYMQDYAGYKTINLDTRGNNTTLVVNGWNSETRRFDPHDLWHARLRIILSPGVINRPVDEACAYLYGGSWGFTWNEILAQFKKYVSDNPNADWLKLYLDGSNFVGTDKTLKISYMLNALIVQKIEKEKGFPVVMELLGCGKKEPGDENYFKALDKLTGINKTNFNLKMQELIKGS